ncbi:hypothetical protein [Mycobacterium spongiae]|uniref:Uncharacterized protein n=1 Tax=Mycobacterium spongiae TaxID=886343 RepID=A0A975JZZ4_9MYCO|nr:hypothetical protein [Mycobacterium spongiae]QUR67673.1 hypothetical protein F6B93_11690 [Mycobacterium spongiae]
MSTVIAVPDPGGSLLGNGIAYGSGMPGMAGPTFGDAGTGESFGVVLGLAGRDPTVGTSPPHDPQQQALAPINADGSLMGMDRRGFHR